MKPASAYRVGDTIRIGAGIVDAEVREEKDPPPPRFNDGSLVNAMIHVDRYVADSNEKKVLKATKGIGTERTRAAIIAGLVEKGHLRYEKIGKREYLVSTQAGRELIARMPTALADPATTAKWEMALGMIEEGAAQYETFMEYQRKFVVALVEEVRRSAPTIPPGPPCPACGNPLRRLNGKRGFFWGCSGYPDCTTTFPDQAGQPALPNK